MSERIWYGIWYVEGKAWITVNGEVFAHESKVVAEAQLKSMGQQIDGFDVRNFSIEPFPESATVDVGLRIVKP